MNTQQYVGNPSILDAEQEKVENAVEVLKTEAEQEDNAYDAELLEAAALKLEKEVLR